MIMKIRKNKLIYLFIPLLLVIILILKSLSSDMIKIPKGEYIESIESPNKEYKLNAYFINGGLLSGDSIRVELENINTSKTKNIYWGYPYSKVNMKWLNNDVVVINDKNLNIHKDTYNWRR